MAIKRRRGISVSDSASSLWGWLVTAAVFAGIGYGVYVAISKVSKHTQQHVADTPGLIEKKATKVIPTEPPAGGRTLPPPPPPRKDLIDRAAGDVNAAVLAKEASRYRGDQTRMLEYLQDANAARRRLEEVAAGGSDVPEHLEPGDEVVMFQDANLTTMEPAAAGEHLGKAARAIPPGSFYKVRAKRFGAPKELYLYFPYPAGAGVAAAGPERVKITVDLAQEIQQQVLSLGTDRLMPDDRRRIERILGEGTASREDYAFLIRRLAKDSAGDAFNEKESFAQQIAALEKLLPSGPVPDAVLTKEAHRIPGSIAGETQATVSIQTALMLLTIPKEEVQIFYKSQDLREEFDRRLKTAIRQPEAFPQLLIWCRDWQMPVHKELVAYHMMQADRNDRQARLAANFYSTGEGKWATRGNIATGGPIPVAPRPETRAQIQPLLEQYGFTEQGGKWFKRTRWETGIDTLHQPGNFPVKLQGLANMVWREDDTPGSRDESLKGRKTTNEPPRLRFLAPAAAQGLATLTVEAPAVLADCQVRAVGAVIEKGHGGRVEVFLTPEGGKSTTLYNVEAGGNDAWHDVTSQVAGKKRFTITARLSTTKDSYHTYARFLMSLPESKQVFWVRGSILQPAPEADRVWIGARP
ncbi:MAG TPA: hypothetical protein VF950_08105 [Planctomycetota bacterium]